MAKNKTTENNLSIVNFLNGVEEKTKRDDSFELCKTMNKATGFEPKMWGTAIIGFGTYHYKYDSGREGDAPLVGFSPRKDALALYFSSEFKDRDELLNKFGKHKTGKACVYIKKLADIDQTILEVMIKNSVNHIQNLYP